MVVYNIMWIFVVLLILNCSFSASPLIGLWIVKFLEKSTDIQKKEWFKLIKYSVDNFQPWITKI